MRKEGSQRGSTMEYLRLQPMLNILAGLAEVKLCMPDKEKLWASLC